MSNFSILTGKFRVQTGASHEPPAARVTKRPRESLACNQCRKSKLRCDRGHPCSSCVKRDTAATCSYQRAAGSVNENGGLTVAEDRLMHLESLVKELMQSREPAQSGNDIATAKPVTPPELPHEPAASIDVAGSDQSNEAQYAGFTHWSAILDDIHELKAVLGGPAGLGEADKPFLPEAGGLDSDLIFGSSENYSSQWIISECLPPKIEVDRLLSTYFQGETFIIPFIHTYHFQRQYRDFWADTANVNPLWLSTLFSICCMASLIRRGTGPNSSSGNSNLTEYSVLHAAAGQCLVLGEYHRPQLFAPEALALYGHCKNLRSLDPSREGGAILSMVVRMAYEMGYHRDPDSFGSFTVFEGEMRRRFWAAIKQMDVMISFQLGLPSNIRLENSDTKSPRNLLDSDFDTDTQVLPESRSENVATKILWFIIKDRQIISFSKVCQDALSFREKSEAEILQLDTEIREMYDTTPEVLRSRPLSESIADSPFLIMTRIYIEFIYLKSICILHRRYMVRGNDFSTRCCVEAGTRLVRQFIDVDKEFSPGGQLHAERWMLTNFTMNDFLSGIMVLCLIVHTRRKRDQGHSTIDSATEAEVMSLLEQAYNICVEKSEASRDSRRVSHVVHLTLNGPMSNATTRMNAQSSQPFAASGPNMESANDRPQGVDLASLSLQTPHRFVEATESPFGLLGPLDFMGYERESLEWLSWY